MPYNKEKSISTLNFSHIFFSFLVSFSSSRLFQEKFPFLLCTFFIYLQFKCNERCWKIVEWSGRNEISISQSSLNILCTLARCNETTQQLSSSSPLRGVLGYFIYDLEVYIFVLKTPVSHPSTTSN